MLYSRRYPKKIQPITEKDESLSEPHVLTAEEKEVIKEAEKLKKLLELQIEYAKDPKSLKPKEIKKLKDAGLLVEE